jgi:hypothetical protein
MGFPMSAKKSVSLPRAISAYFLGLLQASLTYSKDGSRKFGDHVMLFNGKVEGFLGRSLSN